MNSCVALGANICPICGAPHNETVLFHRQLKPVLPGHVNTDWDLCPRHKAMQEDYLALVEAPGPKHGGTLTPDTARPTGAYAHIRRTIVGKVSNVPIDPKLPFIYVEPGVIDKLQEQSA